MIIQDKRSWGCYCWCPIITLTHECQNQCSADHFCRDSCKVWSLVPYQGFLNSVASHLLFKLGSESISEPLITAYWEGFLFSTASDPNLCCQAPYPQTVCLGPHLSTLFCPLDSSGCAYSDQPAFSCSGRLPPYHHLCASQHWPAQPCFSVPQFQAAILLVNLDQDRSLMNKWPSIKTACKKPACLQSKLPSLL